MSDNIEGPPANEWQTLLLEGEAVAEEHRDDGWDVELLRPGDVTVVEDGERRGISVLVPDSQYESIKQLVRRDDLVPRTSEVFRNVVNDHVLLLAVEKDSVTNNAVVIPLAYSLETARTVVEIAKKEDQLDVHVRALSLDDWVTFLHDDASLFGPP